MTAKAELKQKLETKLFEARTAAKWMPREKSSKRTIAKELIKFFGWSPKYYRKTLADLSETTEDLMCKQDWDNINFNHVPSIASARYKKAFNRHTPKYAEYVQSLMNGDTGAKVNAGAIFPYDVIKGVSYGLSFDKTELNHIIAQWDALPNYIGDSNIMPLIDVSGSMTCSAGGNSKSKLTCMDVAVSLGLYLSDKTTGKFKDSFITFSERPELLTLRGNIIDKVNQMVKSSWGMSTNLHAAFDLILDMGVKYNIPESEMPEILLICSDMNFNQCTRFDDTAMQMIERKYEAAGYTAPKIVFWNINASGNSPVKSDKSGAALVSGFSPSIVKSVLNANMDDFTPESICLQTIMDERYNPQI